MKNKFNLYEAVKNNVENGYILSEDEYNVIDKVMVNSGMENSFILGNYEEDNWDQDKNGDAWWDWEAEERVPLEDGIYWVYEGFSSPEDYDLTAKEYKTLKKLFSKFDLQLDESVAIKESRIVTKAWSEDGRNLNLFELTERFLDNYKEDKLDGYEKINNFTDEDIFKLQEVIENYLNSDELANKMKKAIAKYLNDGNYLSESTDSTEAKEYWVDLDKTNDDTGVIDSQTIATFDDYDSALAFAKEQAPRIKSSLPDLPVGTFWEYTIRKVYSEDEWDDWNTVFIKGTHKWEVGPDDDEETNWAAEEEADATERFENRYMSGGNGWN